MRKINSIKLAVTLKVVLQKLVNDTLLLNNEVPNLYLKDGVGKFHLVNEVDLFRDRICCEDNYFDYYQYILEDEEENKCRLFIEK